VTLNFGHIRLTQYFTLWGNCFGLIKMFSPKIQKATYRQNSYNKRHGDEIKPLLF
jgi:hypothetical protein